MADLAERERVAEIVGEEGRLRRSACMTRWEGRAFVYI